MYFIIVFLFFLLTPFIIDHILGFSKYNFIEYLSNMKLGWLVIYFTIAFGFSLIYFNYKDHFYINKDHINKYDNMKITEFKMEFKKHVLKELHNNIPWTQKQISLKSIYIYDFKLDKNGVGFTLKIEVFNNKKFSSNEKFIYSDIFKFNTYRLNISQLNNGFYGFINKEKEEFELKNLEDILFGMKRSSIHEISNTNIEIIKIFLNEKVGFNEQKVYSGNIITSTLSKTLNELINKDLFTYSNMLYFSIVTITTLGYGDILPLTSFGKLLIAMEVIFGIIVLGLFLNGLSKKIENKDE
jgi:hypothetical protein